MLAADLDEVFLAYQRFAAGVDIKVHAHFLALGDDGVDLLKAQVQLVAVFRGPAAGAVQVAGGRGIQQDDPRDVAVVLLAVFLLNGPAQNVGVEDEIGEEGLQLIPIHVVEKVQDELMHVVGRILYHSAHRRPLALEAVGAGAGQLVHPVHQLGHVLLRVFFQIPQRRFQRDFFDRLVFHRKKSSLSECAFGAFRLVLPYCTVLSQGPQWTMFSSCRKTRHFPPPVWFSNRDGRPACFLVTENRMTIAKKGGICYTAEGYFSFRTLFCRGSAAAHGYERSRTPCPLSPGKPLCSRF